MTHTTRMAVDATRHITVDWTVIEYRMTQAAWLVSGIVRLWESTRLHSGVNLASKAISDPTEIVTSASTLDGALTELMRAAWTQCLQGRTAHDTEH